MISWIQCKRLKSQKSQETNLKFVETEGILKIQICGSQKDNLAAQLDFLKISRFLETWRGFHLICGVGVGKKSNTTRQFVAA